MKAEKVSPIKPGLGHAGYATAETVAALPSTEGLHLICRKPALVATDVWDDTQSRKYSSDMWRLIKKLRKHAASKLPPLPANPTPADRINLKLTKQNRDAWAIASIRWLLVADTAVGEPNLLTGSRIYGSLDYCQKTDSEGRLISIVGARAHRLDSWGQTSMDHAEFIDVTDLFWDQYLKFGKCAKNSLNFKEVNHEWQQVTRTSKRCRCCDMWSYRRRQRTIVSHSNSVHVQERTITQTPVWEHQVSHAYANPYFRLLRDGEE